VIPQTVQDYFIAHFDGMGEDQRHVAERQKQINVINILNSQLQPFSKRMSNLQDVPVFNGDAADDNGMPLPNNDNTTNEKKDFQLTSLFNKPIK
jgi:hypothetical protein